MELFELPVDQTQIEKFYKLLSEGYVQTDKRPSPTEFHHPNCLDLILQEDNVVIFIHKPNDKTSSRFRILSRLIDQYTIEKDEYIVRISYFDIGFQFDIRDRESGHWSSIRCIAKSMESYQQISEHIQNHHLTRLFMLIRNNRIQYDIIEYNVILSSSIVYIPHLLRLSGLYLQKSNVFIDTNMFQRGNN